MDEKRPLVSIIVRTKDRPTLLKRALQSICGQTYRPLEVVLVNDGGCDLDTEDLKKLLGDVRLNYIRLEKNAGRAHAGNVGIRNVQGNYVGFLDDDDELYPEHAASLVALLEQLDYKVAYSDCLVVQKEYDPRSLGMADREKELLFSRDFDYDFLLFENYIPFMCLLFRKEVLREAGDIDESLDLYEDWDLLIRIGARHPFFHIRKTTALYNQWAGDMQIAQKNRDSYFVEHSYIRVLSKNRDRITEKGMRHYINCFVEERGRLRQSDRRGTDLERAIKGKDEDIDIYRRANENLESVVKEQEDRIVHLGGTLENLHATIGNLEAAIGNLEATIVYRDATIGNRDATIVNLESKIASLDATIANREAAIANREATIETRDATITTLESAVRNLEAVVGERDSRISELDAAVKTGESRVWELERDLRDRDAALQAIYSSRGWKALRAYYKVRDKLFPRGSKRRLFAKLGLVAAGDPKDFVKSLSRRNIKKFFAQYRTVDPAVVESKVKRKVSCAPGNGGGHASGAEAVRVVPEMSEFVPGDDQELFSPPPERNRVLVIDRSLPAYDKDSGALRMFSFLEILSDLGYRITFLPDDLLNVEPYGDDLRLMGIEVLHGDVNVEQYMKKNGSMFSFVIISRPEQTYKFIALVRAYAIHSTIIYDTVDLHWMRFERTGLVTGDKQYLKLAEEYKAIELFNATSADVAFTVTPEEKEILEREIPGVRVAVVPNIHQVSIGEIPFSRRKDLMFIGGFFHQPNEDAVLYFVKEILPHIRKKLGEVRFFVVGSDPSAAILALNSPDIIVTGYVKDVSPYFNNCRVFVSPLRYGAGMKGKIGQSMSYGLPVVTTTIGAEGIGLTDGENALVADGPEAIADAVVRLYTDEALWSSISRKAAEHIETNYSKAALGKKIGELLDGIRTAQVG
jgi:glycosyltransferase involved in cell wall biosynthesis